MSANEFVVKANEGQVYTIGNLKPNYNITFHRLADNGYNGEAVGTLDFNGPELVFTGDANESAKTFINWVSITFKGRLIEEYKRGFEDAKQGKECTP